MKIFLGRRLGNQGSILLVALILSLIMGMALGSYLYLTQGQEQSVARSQRWNSALDVAEAGIEEGLAQANYTPHDFSLNGWTANGSSYGPQNRTLVGGHYIVTIQGGTTPTIYSTGFVTAPITGTSISRAIRVTTQVMPLFNVGLGAVGNINMNGHTVATTSWNSQTNTLSTNGQYDPSKTSTNGDVASEGGIVNVGNDTINGNLYLGPTATYASGSNQVTGTIYGDYNVNFPDVVLPSSAATAPAPLNINGTNWISGPSGSSYTVNDNQPIYVSPGLTNITIFVRTPNWSPSSITLATNLSGLSSAPYLTVYDEGNSVTLGGNSTGGAIAATPLNFIFYGLPSLTSITLSGTSTFIGAIYAPEANLNLNGGGSSNDLLGAAIVNNATMNGHYTLKYDEGLAQFGPAKGFVANSWQEL